MNDKPNRTSDRNHDLRASSASWWARVRADEAALHAWLSDQLRGEARAAGRIRALRDAFAPAGSRAHRVLTVIAAQEEKHAAWVAALLARRGARTDVDEAVADRYWPKVEALVADLETGAAVGAHAERMRLARIEVIAADPEAPADIRACFARILPEERFHARAFASLAGDRALASTRDAHELGLRALGLTA